MDHFKSEICAEINSRIANLFFENQEKSKSEKLAEEMQISKQYDFSTLKQVLSERTICLRKVKLKIN